MTAPALLNFLIVCWDKRGLQLAQAIEEIGVVYRHDVNKGVAKYTKFIDGEWDPAGAIPEFDALFFHIGRDDPQQIPKDRKFKVEFAFSGGGVRPGDVPQGRPNAIPIQRRFEPDHCPVKPMHLPELRAFVAEPQRELPRFCAPEAGRPALSALAILCQGYAAAAIANDASLGTGSLGHALGWDRLASDVATSLSLRLKPRWLPMQSIMWWRDGLGLNSAASEQEFVVTILEDLDLDVDAHGTFKLSAAAKLSDLPADQLIDYIAEKSKSQNLVRFQDLVELLRIVVLGRSQTVDVPRVATAYEDLKKLLER